MTASSFADVLPPIDGRPPIGTEAWWFSVARRDLQGARRAFESAEHVKRCGGYGWRKRRASWFAGALEWLSMAIDARNHGRELRAKRLDGNRDAAACSCGARWTGAELAANPSAVDDHACPLETKE
jgi:hypothetical protein